MHENITFALEIIKSFFLLYNWGQYGYNLAIPGHISINA